jgi:hypothetical protein
MSRGRPTAWLVPQERLGRSGRVLGVVLLVTYVGFVAAQLLDHAMWRDEAQAWLIARESANLSELHANLRFEGHPPLWHLVIWPIARLSPNVELMKVVTLIIAVGFGALVALGRAVPPLLRPVILAGFLPAFGYGVLSRPYLLGLLLLFGSLELLVREQQGGRPSRDLRLILAVLLGMTHLLFAVLAGALLAGELLTALVRGGPDRRRALLRTVTAGSVLLLLIAVFLPERSSAAMPGAIPGDALSVRALLLSLLEASGDVLGPLSTPRVTLLVVGLLIALAVVRSPLRAVPMGFGVLVLLVNYLIGYGDAWWHIGVTTFALVLLALIALPAPVRTAPVRTAPVRTGRLAGHADVTGALITLLLLPVLAAQVPGTAVPLERLRSGVVYSAGREAAGIVDDWGPTGCPVVVDRSPAGATVSAYLGGRTIHRLDDGRDGTFAIWDDVYGSGEVSWEALRAAMEERGPDTVGVLSVLRGPPEPFVVIGATGAAVWGDEEFLVVALAPDPATDRAADRVAGRTR